MDVIKIFVRWDSEESIARAEVEKTRLENQGYALVKTFSEFSGAVLTYAKE